jgi:sialic acid synthase SpsE
MSASRKSARRTDSPGAESSPGPPGVSPSPDARAVIVAEVGTAHLGDRARAADLIAAAADAGADLVKFQHFYADEIIHPNTGLVSLPGGAIPLYRRFRELETGTAFMEYLKKTCEARGTGFFCSPFGIRSAGELISVGERRFKIASPELNHHPLLTWLAAREECDAMVLSTGVSTLGDIEESLAVISTAGSRRDAGPPDVSILHCITAYPSPEDQFNLRLIPNLSALFGRPAGLSDHSLDPVLVPVLAAFQGASMVEKHFTLNRTDGGLDDPIALNPEDFSRMAQAVRTAEDLRRRGLSPLAHPDLEGVGAERIDAILGTGVKRLAAAETANYGRSNRSIHVLTDLSAGHRLSDGDLAVLRTETVLRPGLHPRHLSQVLGRPLVRNIEAGQGLVWDDLILPAPGS